MDNNLDIIKEHKYLVSVVCAFYNNANNVNALRLLDDLYSLPEYIEIICVNDGSSDNTLEILNRYKDRFKIIDEDNQGVFLAYTAGFKEASGFYSHGIDVDDVFDVSLYNDVYNLVNSGTVADVIAFPRRFVYYKNNKVKKIKEIPFKFKKGLYEITKENFHDFFQPNDPNCVDGYRWNKLLKTSFLKDTFNDYKDIYETKFVFSEDQLHTYPVYLKSKSLYLFDKFYYDYFIYNGSASKSFNYFYEHLKEKDTFFAFFHELLKKANMSFDFVKYLEALSYMSVYYMAIIYNEKEIAKKMRKDPCFKDMLKLFKKTNYFGYLAIRLRLNVFLKMHFAIYFKY